MLPTRNGARKFHKILYGTPQSGVSWRLTLGSGSFQRITVHAVTSTALLSKRQFRGYSWCRRILIFFVFFTFGFRKVVWWLLYTERCSFLQLWLRRASHRILNLLFFLARRWKVMCWAATVYQIRHLLAWPTSLPSPTSYLKSWCSSRICWMKDPPVAQHCSVFSSSMALSACVVSPTLMCRGRLYLFESCSAHVPVRDVARTVPCIMLHFFAENRKDWLFVGILCVFFDCSKWKDYSLYDFAYGSTHRMHWIDCTMLVFQKQEVRDWLKQESSCQKSSRTLLCFFQCQIPFRRTLFPQRMLL